MYSAIDPADSGKVITARKALTDILPRASMNSDLRSILFHRALSFTEIDIFMDKGDATESRERLIELTKRCLDYVEVSSFFDRFIESLRMSSTGVGNGPRRT